VNPLKAVAAISARQGPRTPGGERTRPERRIMRPVSHPSGSRAPAEWWIRTRTTTCPTQVNHNVAYKKSMGSSSNGRPLSSYWNINVSRWQSRWLVAEKGSLPLNVCKSAYSLSYWITRVQSAYVLVASVPVPVQFQQSIHPSLTGRLQQAILRHPWPVELCSSPATVSRNLRGSLCLAASLAIPWDLTLN